MGRGVLWRQYDRTQWLRAYSMSIVISTDRTSSRSAAYGGGGPIRMATIAQKRFCTIA